MMKQSRVTEKEVKQLIQLLETQEIYETNKDARNYIEIIKKKLEK